jgi:hypothetical protein
MQQEEAEAEFQPPAPRHHIEDTPEHQYAPLEINDEHVVVVAELKMVHSFKGDCSAESVDWTQERVSRMVVADLDHKGITSKVNSALWSCEVRAVKCATITNNSKCTQCKYFHRAGTCTSCPANGLPAAR